MKTRLAVLQAKQQGQTLIEVIVALALGVVVITALVGLGARANRNANYSKISEIASKFAQEGLELARSIRDKNGPVLGVSGCLPSCNTWDDLYTGNIGNFTAVFRPPTSISQINCSNLTAGSSWCLDTGNPSVASTPVDGTFAPGTGGIKIQRNILVADDATPGVSQCFLTGIVGLVLTSADVKSVKVIVTWTDPSGPHTINLQSCITRRT